jgi:hypothetical protein
MGTSAEKDVHFVSQLHKLFEVRPESLLPAEVATRKRRTKRTRRMVRVETKVTTILSR